MIFFLFRHAAYGCWTWSKLQKFNVLPYGFKGPFLCTGGATGHFTTCTHLSRIQMSKRDPFRDPATQHSAATARSSRGHDHTRVPSILLAFGIGAHRGLCFFVLGGEKRQPAKETNQSLHWRWAWTLSVFVYSDLSEGWETPRLYKIITCFFVLRRLVLCVCVLALNNVYSMLSPFLFSGVHLANDPSTGGWNRTFDWKKTIGNIFRTPSWRYGCFKK